MSPRSGLCRAAGLVRDVGSMMVVGAPPIHAAGRTGETLGAA
jgi:hypothetical protein